MSNSMKIFAAFLLTFLMLSGCGQKGPLFLPGDTSSIRTEVQQIPAEESEEEDDEDETPVNIQN